MALRPNFRDPFGEYFDGPSTPLARAEYRDIQSRIIENEDKIQALRKAPMPLRRALDYAINEIKTRLAVGSYEIGNDLIGLREALCRRANGYPANTDTYIVSLLRKFCDFDEEQLHEAFADEYPDEATEDDPAAEIMQLEEDIEILRIEAADAWPSDVSELAPMFRSGRVPDLYLGMQLGVNVDAQQIAGRITDDYMNEYRSRARQFNVPVTFNGKAISSLPQRQKNDWMALYAKLRLNPMQLQGVYSAIYENNTQDDSVPENPMFKRS